MKSPIFYFETKNENIGDIEVVEWFSGSKCSFLIDDVRFVRIEKDSFRTCIFRMFSTVDLQNVQSLIGQDFYGSKFTFKKVTESYLKYIPQNWFDEPTELSTFTNWSVHQISCNEVSQGILEFRSFLNSYDRSFSQSVIGKVPKSGVSGSFYSYPQEGKNFKEFRIMEEKKSKKKIRICVISDTHGNHEKLSFDGLEKQEVDVLIHCGDFTDKTTGIWSSIHKDSPPPEPVVQFNKFLGTNNFLSRIKYKIIVAGNHDLGFLDSFKDSFSMEKRQLILTNSIFLNNSSISVPERLEKSLKIHCIGFNSKNEKREDLRKKVEEIPEDTNILISHFPPLFGQNVDLFVKSQIMKDLKIVCFGHLHYRHFVKKIGRVVYIAAPSFSSIKHEINPVILFNYYM